MRCHDARAIAEGMLVDPARMRANLDASGGLIVAEAVMMGLAPKLGREAAHHVVKRACDRALAERLTLAQSLAQESAVTAQFDGSEIAALVDPAHYLGSSAIFIDRVVAQVRALV